MGIVSRDVARMGYGLGSLTRAASSGADRDAVFYASKVGARPLPEGPAPMTAAQKPSELCDAVHENLRSLGTDHLDVVYLRRMDMQPGFVIEDPRAREIAEQRGVTPNQVGLAWVLARSPQSLVISGTASPDHLRENVEAAGVHLPAEVLRELDAAA